MNNPRGLELAPDGSLYVAESGKGGSGPCFAAGEGPVCYGPTGSVTKIDRKGKVSRVATGLFSAAGEGGFAATGPADVAVAGKKLYVTLGMGSNPANRTSPELKAAGTLIKVNLKSGKVRTVADLGAFEADGGPDGDPDTNPYGVVKSGRSVIVADAGANSLIKVRKGKVSRVAFFPNQPNPLFPNLGGPDYDAVPTSVDVAPDGSYLVSQLTGFPFLQGAANVYRVTRSGKVSVWASGLTNVVGVAAARDGLYVAQMTQTGLPEFGTFANGSIIKISWWNPNKRTVVASGLSSVGGVEVGKDGTVYATTNSVVPGGGTVIAIKQH